LQNSAGATLEQNEKKKRKRIIHQRTHHINKHSVLVKNEIERDVAEEEIDDIYTG